jgi:hypothetical protein
VSSAATTKTEKGIFIKNSCSMNNELNTLKFYKAFERCIKKITTTDSALRNRGLSYLDDYLDYLRRCNGVFENKVISGKSSSKKTKNTFTLKFQEFVFTTFINEDLSLNINVKLIRNSDKTLDPSFLKSMYKEKKGYVYFLKSEHGWKIGQTNSLQRRFKEIKTLLPFELNLEYTIKTSDYVELEKKLHNFFKDKRINGEWFLLNDDDIKSLYSFCKENKLFLQSKNK